MKNMKNRLREDKIRESITEFNIEFQKWDVMRHLFKTYTLPHFDVLDLEKDFVRIGYSHIIPRNFFTDVQGEIYYDNKGIGSNYGKGIAFGETRYILNILENKIDEKDYKQREKTTVTSLISALFNTYPETRFAILANPIIVSNFMYRKGFRMLHSDSRWGLFNDRPLYWNPEIQTNIVYLVDRDLGKLYVKEDIKMEVQEILPSEYDGVLKDVNTLSITDLPNMVRIKASELIYFKARDSHRDGVIKITMTESEKD